MMQIPNNIEAEQAVLCCALIDSRTLPIINNSLVSTDFYSSRHQIIFKHIQMVGDTVDIVNLKDSLVKADELKKVGGDDYLMSLATAIATTAGIQSYIKILSEYSVRRKLIDIGTSIVEQSYSGDIDQIISDVKDNIVNVSNCKDEEIDNFKLFNKVYNIVFDKQTPGLFTNIPGIEKRFYLENGSTNCIAAESNVGKSAFALQMAEYLSDRYGDVLYFTLESSKERLGMRLLCRNTMIPLSKLNKCGGDDGYNDVQAIDLQDQISRLQKTRLNIIDSSKYTYVENIINYCESYRLKHNLKAVFIDFLQMLDTLKSINVAREKINYVILKLKELAKRLDVPVIYLSQLRKDIEGRPKVDDLIESNYIRTHTDYIMMLYAPNRDDDKYQYTTELFLVKGKDQERFSTWLYFDGRFQLFTAGQRPPLIQKKSSKGHEI